MGFHETAERIKENAHGVVRHLELINFMKELGSLHFVGSYALNVMTWNDIDLQLVPDCDLPPKEILARIFHHFLFTDGFVRAKVIDFQEKEYKPEMPRGLYLGSQFILPALGGEWKVDLWILSEKDFEESRKFMSDIQKIMTPSIRELILEIKHAMMDGEHRVPQMGSYRLYQALLAGCRNKEELIEALCKKK